MTDLVVVRRSSRRRHASSSLARPDRVPSTSVPFELKNRYRVTVSVSDPVHDPRGLVAGAPCCSPASPAPEDGHRHGHGEGARRRDAVRDDGGLGDLLHGDEQDGGADAAFRKAIGVRIKEETEMIEAKSLDEIDRPATSGVAKTES